MDWEWLCFLSFCVLRFRVFLGSNSDWVYGTAILRLFAFSIPFVFWAGGGYGNEWNGLGGFFSFFHYCCLLLLLLPPLMIPSV